MTHSISLVVDLLLPFIDTPHCLFSTCKGARCNEERKHSVLRRLFVANCSSIAQHFRDAKITTDMYCKWRQWRGFSDRVQITVDARDPPNFKYAYSYSSLGRILCFSENICDGVIIEKHQFKTTYFYCEPPRLDMMPVYLRRFSFMGEDMAVDLRISCSDHILYYCTFDLNWLQWSHCTSIFTGDLVLYQAVITDTSSALEFFAFGCQSSYAIYKLAITANRYTVLASVSFPCAHPNVAAMVLIGTDTIVLIHTDRDQGISITTIDRSTCDIIHKTHPIRELVSTCMVIKAFAFFNYLVICSSYGSDPTYHLIWISRSAPPKYVVSSASVAFNHYPCMCPVLDEDAIPKAMYITRNRDVTLDVCICS